MPFATDFTFSRGSGKTRTNAAGLVVGVDFSTTSNTVTTGSKTFTLTATANVNRDWAVASNVRAVDQVGGGALVGTVTSYNPVTQDLVINVTSVTGSGTGTNWRIGSLEMTRDLTTNAIGSEAAATNLLTRTEEFENAAWTNLETVVTANNAISPCGSTDADLIVPSVTNTAKRISQTITTAATSAYTFSCFVKKQTSGYDFVALVFGATSVQGGNRGNAIFNINTGVLISTSVTGSAFVSKAEITPFINGWYRCSVSFVASSGTETTVAVGVMPIPTATSNTVTAFSGDGVSGALFWGAQFEANGLTSYIPATTVQVTRSADSFALTAGALNSIRQGEATLYAEVSCPDTSPVQKRALRLSGASGDIRLAKRGTGGLNGFATRSILEVDNFLYFGTGSGNSLRDNGKEILSFSAANNERTGTSITIDASNALAYDGSNIIARVGGGSVEEIFLTKDLATFSGKGLGSNPFNGAHWNGSTFLLCGTTTGIIVTSTDGLTFKRTNTPVISQACNEITSMSVLGTVRNVVVGTVGFIATSDDNGTTWTSRTSGTTSTITGVTSGLGIFLFSRANSTTNVSTSTDGITWTARTTVTGQSQNDITFNGTNLFMSVGNAGSIQTSPDGITWTSRTSGTTQILRGVHFANGLWVAVGDAGTIITSPDGINWTVRSSGSTQNLSEIGFFNGLYIVVGAAGFIGTSPDGITWTPRNNIFGSTFNSIAASSNRVVLCGNSGLVASSDDGILYTGRSSNNATVSGIAFGNGTFVSVGAAQHGFGYIATIDLAGNYTRRFINAPSNMNSVRFLEGAFYVGAGGSGGGIHRSVDGISWTQVLVTSSSTNSVTFGAGVFVGLRASINTTQVSTSTDGLNWSVFAEAGGVSGRTMRDIVFANGVFVIVGTLGTILTSTTGLEGSYVLRQSNTTQDLSGVIYSVRDQLWYVTGSNGTMLFSKDAITWQLLQNAGFVSIDNTTLQANPMLPVFKAGRNRLAVSYKNNQVIASLNGVSVTDTSATIPTITAGALAENLNGLVYKAIVYNAALSEVELNAITGL